MLEPDWFLIYVQQNETLERLEIPRNFDASTIMEDIGLKEEPSNCGEVRGMIRSLVGPLPEGRAAAAAGAVPEKKKGGPASGNSNVVFYAAYVFFEKEARGRGPAQVQDAAGDEKGPPQVLERHRVR